MPKIKRAYNILAIDPATNCGWATKDVFGVWKLKPMRDESMGMRLIRFKAKLLEVIEAEKITLVVFERPAGRNVNAVIVHAELQAVIKTVCEEQKVEYRAYSASEIKSHATGKGNSGKPLMIEAAGRIRGYAGNDDNEADAICLYDLANTMYNI